MDEAVKQEPAADEPRVVEVQTASVPHGTVLRICMNTGVAAQVNVGYGAPASGLADTLENLVKLIRENPSPQPEQEPLELGEPDKIEVANG